MTALTVVYLPIDELIPYARNSRTHSDAQVAQIAGSIREFGWTNPVLIDGDGSIIAGHGRLAAARQLGMQAVPCIRLGHLTPTQRKALIIADNKLALNAGWDEELLRLELQDLESDGFDLAITGFDGSELDALLSIGAADELPAMPGLPDGDKEPFQQMTFTLHDEQAEQVTAALGAAKAAGAFIDSPNENSNGNALARICETYLTSHAHG